MIYKRVIKHIVLPIETINNYKVLAAFVLISLLIILFAFTPLKIVFDFTLFKSFIQKYEGYVELIFITTYTILTVVGIPGTILTVVGGCLFGLWYGTLISIFSATLGALLAFLTARYLLQDFVQQKLSQNNHLNKFQASVLDRPFSFVLTTRLVPVSPFNLVNYLFGLTKIDWTDYTIATFIGVIPGCFAYTWIGKSGEKVMMGGDRFSLFMALAFLALLSIIPWFYRRKKRA